MTKIVNPMNKSINNSATLLKTVKSNEYIVKNVPSKINSTISSPN